jgi:uncharacterized protein
MAPPTVATIPASEVRVLSSSVANQDYLISVALPFHYDERPDQTYPVIYVLDANLYFGMVVDIVRAMNIRVSFCNELPDAFVVGVGYPVNGSLLAMLHHVMHLRLRDFMEGRNEGAEQFIQEHFPIPKPIASGNAGPFLHFLTHELIPFIESAYRVDAGNRTLLGHSWAGDFALYSLFKQPQVFQRCVVASAGLDDDPGRAEQAYAAHHDSLPVRLHLLTEETSAADIARLNATVALLESRRYAGLQLTHQIIANVTHCAMVAPAFQAGLVAVFS